MNKIAFSAKLNRNINWSFISIWWTRYVLFILTIKYFEFLEQLDLQNILGSFDKTIDWIRTREKNLLVEVQFVFITSSVMKIIILMNWKSNTKGIKVSVRMKKQVGMPHFRNWYAPQGIREAQPQLSSFCGYFFVNCIIVMSVQYRQLLPLTISSKIFFPSRFFTYLKIKDQLQNIINISHVGI